MTDNFKLIRQYFIDNDIPQHNESGLLKHYVVEIMSRGKDNPDMSAANRHFKNYYFPCIDKFDQYESEIKKVCDALRMRAYVSVNYKMYDQVLMDTAAEAATRAAAHNYGKPYSVYEHCSGKYVNRKDKKFVVDIDEEQMIFFDSIYDDLKDKVVLVVPTRTGMHLVTTPFNTLAFENKCVDRFGFTPDIKKNHLTLLYENL
jgi:hypothetical protein